MRAAWGVCWSGAAWWAGGCADKREDLRRSGAGRVARCVGVGVGCVSGVGGRTKFFGQGLTGPGGSRSLVGVPVGSGSDGEEFRTVRGAGAICW